MILSRLLTVINLFETINGVAGAKPPTGMRGGSPHYSPARMPGVYAKRLCTMQSQPSIHNPSPRGRGLGLGIENLLYFLKI